MIALNKITYIFNDEDDHQRNIFYPQQSTAVSGITLLLRASFMNMIAAEIVSHYNLICKCKEGINHAANALLTPKQFAFFPWASYSHEQI